jgi:hypothetical protein
VHLKIKKDLAVMKEDISQAMSLLWIKFLQKFMTKYYQIIFKKRVIGFLQDSKYFLDLRTIKGTTKHL